MIESYQRVVAEKNGKYFVSIPELGMIASNENLQQAWSEIEAMAKESHKAFAAADLDDEFPKPRRAGHNTSVQVSALNGFLIRVAGVTVGALLFVLVSIYGVNIMIKTNIDSTIQQVKTELEAAEIDWPRLRRNIIRSADPSKSLPEAEKQALVDALERLGLRYQPYVGAFMKLFPEPEENENSQSQKPE